jgi:hypothetical protein
MQSMVLRDIWCLINMGKFDPINNDPINQDPIKRHP